MVHAILVSETLLRFLLDYGRPSKAGKAPGVSMSSFYVLSWKKSELAEEGPPNYLSEESVIEAESNGWKASKSYVLSQVCKIMSHLELGSFWKRKKNYQSLHTS